MKVLITLFLIMMTLSACNFKEGLKEMGDGVQGGVQNAGEALKEVPAGISDASNEVEADIKK